LPASPQSFRVSCSPPLRDLPSFPTRRSSDLGRWWENTRYLSPHRDEVVIDFFLERALDEIAQDPRHREQTKAVYRRSKIVTFRRSEEHTSKLQSRENLVCRLLLEKKKILKIA